MEFQWRRHKKEEAWAELADNLCLLAGKVFPELEEEAKEQLSLDYFLSLLDNPELLSVKQKQPKTTEDAVATSWMWPYIHSSHVHQVSTMLRNENTHSNQAWVHAIQSKQDALMEM